MINTLNCKCSAFHEKRNMTQRVEERATRDYSQNLESNHGEGNGTPLQYSCLENPMDGEPGRRQSMGLLRVGHN